MSRNLLSNLALAVFVLTCGWGGYYLASPRTVSESTQVVSAQPLNSQHWLLPAPRKAVSRSLTQLKKANHTCEALTTPLSAITDTQLLSCHLEAALKHPPTLEFSVVAERLLALDPKNAVAVYYLLRAHYREWILSGARSQSDEVRAYLDTYENLIEQDPDLSEMKLRLALADEDIVGIRVLALDVQRREPQSELASYYLAWAAYESGDKGTSEAYLRAILERNPQNNRAKQSLNALQYGNGGAPIFQVADGF